MITETEEKNRDEFLIMIFLICLLKIEITLATNEYETDVRSDISNKVSNKVYGLKDLFNTTSWRMNINASSPCTYIDNDRLEKCHQVYVYNETAYLRYVQQLQTMILSQLNIKTDGTRKLKTSQIKLLKEINDGERNTNWIRKTRFDKIERKHQILNHISNIEEIYKCKFIENSDVNIMDSMCLKFSATTANLFYLDQQNSFKRLNATVRLFLYFETLNTKIKCQNIKIKNSQTSKTITTKIENGWNSVNINDLVISNHEVKHINDSLFKTLVITSEKDCSIETGDIANKSSAVVSKLYLSSFHDHRPLLEIIYNNDLQEDSSKHFQPLKQKRDSDVDILKNACKVPLNLNGECCLIQYYVEFRTIFKPNFILKPLGFPANYCFGKCFGKIYNIQPNPGEPLNHAEIKNQFNLHNKKYDKFMPTCCHPTTMESLYVTYIDSAGNTVSANIPNMITTSCGCS